MLLADEAERLGVDMPELPAIAQARIRELLPYAGTRNPVDVTAQITNTPEILGPCSTRCWPPGRSAPCCFSCPTSG
ncbi:hypothetical protein FT173_017420 [Bordetella pertussis]